jgi:hypothetical protein
VLENEQSNGKAQMANLVEELEQSLEGGGDEAGGGGGGGAVHSLRYEIDLWQRRAKRGTEPAQTYWEALEPMGEKMAIVEVAKESIEKRNKF